MHLSKWIKFFISVILYSISISTFAQSSPVIPIKAVEIQQQFITNALQYINAIWLNSNATSRQLTEKYFTSDTTLIINGKQVYTGYDQLENHFKQVGENIHGKFQFPFIEVISDHNKIVTRFDEDIVDNQGVHYPANVIAIFSLHDGKIQRWEEVANTQYFCQAESAKIVFSK